MATLLKISNFTVAFLLKMDSCIAKVLNKFCSSSPIDSDQAALEAFIEEYFFDEACEDEDPNPPSKIDNKTGIQKLCIINR